MNFNLDSYFATAAAASSNLVSYSEGANAEAAFSSSSESVGFGGRVGDRFHEDS